jgi:hypothetical protein
MKGSERQGHYGRDSGRRGKRKTRREDHARSSSGTDLERGCSGVCSGDVRQDSVRVQAGEVCKGDSGVSQEPGKRLRRSWRWYWVWMQRAVAAKVVLTLLMSGLDL